ncbi:carboxyltransferase domain-containing protein [Roseibacterium sp. SDUM158017]|uniref:5-oxoprolinase subunit B family protein n=1 Tax=Roseicyclus salinarum TaxID=3036773 RepID=UPI0024156FFC|nr:carboxyltransferase domain-containing protein [Roseibacterium sp. SDUM158017]MDG4650595.1 carboxyltransferase domain-containing protein [Roseibacterium sp. SDUM158017]
MKPASEPDNGQFPRIDWLGLDGLLVRFGEVLGEPANRAALALRHAVEREGWPGVEEVTTSLVSTYLRFDPLSVDADALRATLAELVAGRDWTRADLPGGRRLWRVPAVFGTDLAPQLEEAAALAGLTPDRAVQEIAATRLRVQTIGFAPGQPYLGELPGHWTIPRQTELTPKVRVGALCVAIRQMTLFSVSTPTGWRQVAQTALRLFRPESGTPFLLRPGDEVMFQPVAREAWDRLCAEGPDGGAVAELIE